MDNQSTRKPHPDQRYPGRQRAHYLLVIGAVVGLLLAASGLLEQSANINTVAVATVNERVISKQDYLNYLSLLARDKRNPLTDSDRRHVLNRMIEEKLLIERGIAVGLTDSDPTVRKAISNAMIQTVIADIASAEPDEGELQAFYQQNINYFAKPARIHVQRMIFRAADNAQALQQARQAQQRLQSGDSFAQVKAALGSSDIVTIPNAMLPPNKLRQYIGPQLTAAAMTMEAGDISAPLEDGSGYSVLLLIAKEQATPQPLSAVREQVANEFRRRAGDKALRDYLQQLRQQADITIDQSFLDSLATVDAPAEQP